MLVDDGAVGAVEADGRINVEREDSDGGDVSGADADEPEGLEVGDGVEHTDVTVDRDDEDHETRGTPNRKNNKVCL